MKNALLCTPVIFSLLLPFAASCSPNHDVNAQEKGRSQFKQENSDQITEKSSHSRHHTHHKGNHDRRPNILFILADDLGYSDIGAFGGEIHTPNIDKLAKSGVRMTNFHANPTCSVTRSSFLTGTDSHLAGVGSMQEAHDELPEEAQASENYQGYLKDSLETFPQKLQEAGYHTYMAGKWHLAHIQGGPPAWIAGSAAAKGFDRSFILLQGGASHFEDKIGVHPFGPVALYMEDRNIVNELPEGFYSTKFYTDKLIEYIDENHGDGKPFFAYAAYTAPHWPLQVPDEWLDRYKGRYDAGYEVLRQERLARMKSLGILPENAETYPGMPEVADWDMLTADEKATEAREMEIYAAMVDYMDDQIGRLIGHLKEIKEYNNTIIMVVSDNGAEAMDPRATFPPYIPGVTSGAIDAFYAQLDESYENIGKPASFTSYSVAWGEVSATPHRFFKTTTAEGGIRVPMIVKYPHSGLRRGAIYDEFATIQDLAPTFLELAKAELPVQELRGETMVPFFEGYTSQIHDEDYGHGWEFMGYQGFIQNNYKIFMKAPTADVLLPTTTAAGGDGVTWSLYDLAVDQAELVDLADDPRFTNVFNELKANYEQFAEETGVIKIWP